MLADGESPGFRRFPPIPGIGRLLHVTSHVTRNVAGLRGESLPLPASHVSPDPFCGDTPQRPERKRRAAIAVTG
jgi:hypothetical protein